MPHRSAWWVARWARCAPLLIVATGCTQLVGNPDALTDAGSEVITDTPADGADSADSADTPDVPDCPPAPSDTARITSRLIALPFTESVHYRGAFLDHARRLYAFGSTIDRVSMNNRGTVVRFLRTGAIDTSFAGRGYVMIGPPEGSTQFTVDSMTEDARGRLLLAGHHSAYAISGEYVYRGWITRVDESGVTDRTFGSDGSAEIAGASMGPAYINDVAVDDTRIVVVGGDQHQFAAGTLGFVAALDDRGMRDASFAAGVTLFDFEADRYSVVRATTQGYIVGGTSRKGGARILRMGADGQPDQTFGEAGVATHPAVPSLSVRALAVGDDGSILVAGGFALRPAIEKFDPLGRPDMTFGFAGAYATTLVNWDVGYAFASTLASQCDGALFVASERLFRVAPSGRHDHFFETPIAPTREAVFGVVVDPIDGTVTVLAGINGHVTTGLAIWTLRP